MDKYGTMTDEQLISEMRGGDTEVMDYIMDKYKPMVRKKPAPCICSGARQKI